MFSLSHTPRHISSQYYRPDIDGLRAIAVLAIIFFHCSWLKGGFVGVDIFFVISGYLISSTILKEMNNGTFKFYAFYQRRVRRIFPALILVMALCYFFGWINLFSDEFKRLSRHMFGASIFSSNFILLNESGYFDAQAISKPFLHLWSLGVEEQFYIVFPFFLWITYKKKLHILCAVVFMLLVSFCFNIISVNSDATKAFYLPQARFWELMVGSFISLTMLTRQSTKKNTLSSVQVNTLSSVGLVLLAFSFIIIDRTFLFPGKWATIPVLGTALIIYSGPNAWPNRIILSNKFFVYIGLISFPLYLWHWPVLSFAHLLSASPVRWIVKVSLIFMSILLAWLTYKFIEIKIRLNGNLKAKTITLLVGMCSLGAVSFFVYHSNYKSDLAIKMLPISKQFGWEIPAGSDEQKSDCRNMFPERSTLGPQERDDNFCILQKKAPPNVILVGDSLNLSLFPGLDKYLDYNIAVLSASSAVPFYNSRSTEFNDSIRKNNYKLTNQALDYAISSKNVKVVVLSSFMAPSLTHNNSAFRITDINNPKNEDAYQVFSQALSFTLQTLLKNGKNVIYVMPNPTLFYDIASCLNQYRPFSLDSNESLSCFESIKEHENFVKIYKSWVDSVLKDFPMVKIFDPSDILCDEHNCYGMKSGKILYRDGAHLSVNGSELVASSLHDLIAEMLETPNNY